MNSEQFIRICFWLLHSGLPVCHQIQSNRQEILDGCNSNQLNWAELRRAAVTNVRGHGHTWRDLQHFHLQIQLVLRVGGWVSEWLVVVVVKFLSCPTCIVVSGSFSPAAAASLLFSVFCVVDCFVLVAQWPDQWHIQWTWTVKVCNSTGCEFYANCRAEQMSHDYWTVMDGTGRDGWNEYLAVSLIVNDGNELNI